MKQNLKYFSTVWVMCGLSVIILGWVYLTFEKVSFNYPIITLLVYTLLIPLVAFLPYSTGRNLKIVRKSIFSELIQLMFEVLFFCLFLFSITRFFNTDIGFWNLMGKTVFYFAGFASISIMGLQLGWIEPGKIELQRLKKYGILALNLIIVSSLIMFVVSWFV